MARRKSGVRTLADKFNRDLTLEERTSRMRPNALNSGNEQQSELEPSYRPPAPPAAAPPKRAARPATPGRLPATPRPRTPPLPPSRPTPPFSDPTPPINLPQLGTPMPQYDPLGAVTGMQPPAPGSSPQGWPAAPGGVGQGPPLTGPLSDRASGAAGMDPGAAWAAKVNTALPPLPVGQSAAGAVGSALSDGFNNWAAQQNAAGVPPQGPPAPNAPPPGIMDPNGGVGAILKRYLPPFGGI